MEDIEAFLAVIEAGSQTAAARRLGRSLQAVNRSLVALERSVGVELVRRTTRKSFATEAGLAFYRRVKPAAVEITEARLEAANCRAEPSGLLRIAAPVLLGSTFVVPALAEFTMRYPRIKADLRVSDRAIHLVDGGFDLAVRIRELPDSSPKMRRLGEVRTVVYASPDYLARYGCPNHPDGLVHHHCILRSTSEGESETWRFRINGRLSSVRVTGRFSTDNASAAQQAACHGDLQLPPTGSGGARVHLSKPLLSGAQEHRKRAVHPDTRSTWRPYSLSPIDPCRRGTGRQDCSYQPRREEYE
jgi:DNA-binding transcriptional LysR family regulator